MSLARLPGFNPARLHALRVAHSLSIRDLADLAGTSIGAVQKWEAGRSAPDPHHARTVAQALNASVRDLTDVADDEVGLTELRAFGGLTLRDLSEATGIDRTTLSRIELGHRAPTNAHADALAAVLHLAPPDVRAVWERVRARRLASLRRRPPGGRQQEP